MSILSFFTRPRLSDREVARSMEAYRREQKIHCEDPNDCGGWRDEDLRIVWILMLMLAALCAAFVVGFVTGSGLAQTMGGVH